MEIFTIFALTGFMFFMKFGSLVWLLWQLRVSIDLKNDIYCQAFVDILTKLHRNVT